jgi:hypothetical protein
VLNQRRCQDHALINWPGKMRIDGTLQIAIADRDPPFTIQIMSEPNAARLSR